MIAPPRATSDLSQKTNFFDDLGIIGNLEIGIWHQRPLDRSVNQSSNIAIADARNHTTCPRLHRCHVIPIKNRGIVFLVGFFIAAQCKGIVHNASIGRVRLEAIKFVPCIGLVKNNTKHITPSLTFSDDVAYSHALSRALRGHAY